MIVKIQNIVGVTIISLICCANVNYISNREIVSSSIWFWGGNGCFGWMVSGVILFMYYLHTCKIKLNIKLG